jgi:hypothetical protein
VQLRKLKTSFSVKIKRLVIWSYAAFGNKEKLFRRALDRPAAHQLLERGSAKLPNQVAGPA